LLKKLKGLTDGNGFDSPLAGHFDQFTITVKFIDFTFVAWQDTDHRFAIGTQSSNGLTQA
jgi:hypothetical protein